MKLQTILIDTINSGISVIRINRPRCLNTFNLKFFEELGLVLKEIKNDSKTKIIIITGEGKTFSTGIDFDEIKEKSKLEFREYLYLVQEITLELLELSIPTIAAINGHALGSGIELALTCDIRIASTSAEIGFPEAKISNFPTSGTLKLLKDLVGRGKASYLLFSSKILDANEAYKIGLVDFLAEENKLFESTLEVANEIMKNSHSSVSLIKKGLKLNQDGATLNEILRYEIESSIKAFYSTK